MSLSKVVSVGVLTAVLAVLGAALSAQDRPVLRALISDTAAPGIDTGVHDSDPVRGPYSFERQAPSNGLPYLRGSIIVKFKAGTPATSQRVMLARAGAAVMDTGSNDDFQIVRIDPAADPDAIAQQFAEQPDVEYAQPRHVMHPFFVPNDPLYSRQWNYPLLDMEHAWDLNPGATSSIIVAVLDSGVAYRNVLLRFRADQFVLEGPPRVALPALGIVDVPFAAAPDLGGQDRFVTPRDFIWNDTNPLDLDGHGTHVAGTVGQLTNNGVGVAGMAFNVRIMPVKVIQGTWDEIFNSPERGTDDVVSRGIRYAVDNGAKVLNMSFGEVDGPSPVIRSALEYAVSRGAFVSISAGNEFERGNKTAWPAAYAPEIQGVVAVGAVGPDRQRAYYSSTGSYVELAAPGGNARIGGAAGAVLQQTFNFDFVDTFINGPRDYGPPRFDVFAYAFLQGTSMAAPHVSGFAALLMQQGITNPAAIEAAMEHFATDLGTSGRDNEYGYGLINPRAALRGLGLMK